MALQTPPELQAYGWTTADLWCAPIITGLYALLTHAQPFWADVHRSIAELFQGGGYTIIKGVPVEPIDPEVARAVCAFLLSALFVGRTAKNFGLWKPFQKQAKLIVERLGQGAFRLDPMRTSLQITVTDDKVKTQ